MQKFSLFRGDVGNPEYSIDLLEPDLNIVEDWRNFWACVVALKRTTSDTIVIFLHYLNI
jgi:hypothetical protein